MEGLLGLPMAIESPAPRSRSQENLIHRWLVVLFMAMLGIIAIAYLSAEVFGEV